MPSETGEPLSISGRVVDLTTGDGVSDLLVEAWDREQRVQSALGSATTASEGGFRMSLDAELYREWVKQRIPEVYFRVSRAGQTLLTTEEMVIWGPDDEGEVLIEVDLVALDTDIWLRVDSFEDLMAHESEILELISDMPKGGNLFMAHPIMCLKDVGVQLSEQAVQELLEREPHLAALSPQPYLALKRSKEEQHIRFNLRGLFHGGES